MEYLIVNNAEFSILDDTTYPEIKELPSTTIAKENSLQFAMLLEKVNFLLTTSSNVDTLFNSIKLIFQDNFIELASTDSYRLIYLKKSLENMVNKDILVPADSMSVIYKILKIK